MKRSCAGHRHVNSAQRLDGNCIQALISIFCFERNAFALFEPRLLCTDQLGVHVHVSITHVRCDVRESSLFKDARNGARWHRALVAGTNNVLSRQEYLNKINVFPVPDGDTGTNMTFTLTSILDSTIQKIHPRADHMLALIADAALDGARGNSGVILAQFFQGLSDGSAGVEKMTPESFSKAVKFGAEYARQALAEPKEGTIITVLTDFSNHLIELIEC